MSSAIDKVIDDNKINSALLRVLADNSYESIVITDATVQGKII